MQYRVYLTDGEVVFTDWEHERFISALTEHLPGIDIRSFNARRGIYFFNKNHYIMSVPEETPEGQSTVIMPPSPQQLKSEQDKKESERPVTLDDQLASEEVGA